MTDSESQIRSRRSLLAAVGGGVAAYAAAVLGRPQVAHAGSYPLELGVQNNAYSVTSIVNATANQTTFQARGTGSGIGLHGVGDSGIGVYATSTSGAAILASSTSGFGVHANSGSSRGVVATSFSSHGLYAQSYAAGRAANVGHGQGDATGVLGHSGESQPPAGPIKTGVYGYAAQDDDATGVTGESPLGTGVRGITGSGNAVLGLAHSGGIAVYGVAPSTGLAFRAEGPVEFDSSGIASVAVGFRATTVEPGFEVRPNARILCTLESNQASLFIHRVVKNVATDTFRIVLSDVVATGKTANVAWLLIG